MTAEPRGGVETAAPVPGVRNTARVAVVIVSYNTRGLIRRCLESIQAFAPRATTEVVVVDNASRDGSVEMLAAEFPSVRVIANRLNLGYAVAVNQGIEASAGDYVLVLNPDIVVRPGAIDRLVDFMDAHPSAGIAGAKLLNTDGTLQHSCRGFYTPMTLVMRRTPLGRFFPNSPVIRRHLLLDYDHATPRAVDWVIGACMMARRTATDAVGGMDERFFLYFEDVDWCYRMSRQGWEVWYLPEAEMVHEHRRDSAKPKLSRSFWAHLGSMLRYYEKWNVWSYALKRHREPLKIGTFIIADLAATNLAFLGAYRLRVLLQERFANPLYGLENYDNFWVFTNIVTLLSFYFTGQYRIARGKHAADELFDLGRALFLAVVVIMASTYIAHERLISRAVVVLFFVLGLALVWAFRRTLRALHARVLEMRLDLRRVAIAGTEEETRALRTQLASRPELGLDVVGWVSMHGPTPRALGTLDDLAAVVREHRVQQILVAPSAAGVENVARILQPLRRRAVEVQVMTGFAELLGADARVERFADVPVLAFGRDTLHALRAAGKRLFDIVAASVLIVLGAIPAVVYSLVARRRGGSLFERESALGRDACPIEVWRVRGDLRLPPSDFVNLPGLAAVVRGRWSLVGTCPLPPAHATELAAWQRLRFEAKPGMTGFWRLLPPAEASLDRVVQLDLHYVQNRSLGLDFRLLLQSAGHMLTGRGARPDLGPTA